MRHTTLCKSIANAFNVAKIKQFNIINWPFAFYFNSHLNVIYFSISLVASFLSFTMYSTQTHTHTHKSCESARMPLIWTTNSVQFHLKFHSIFWHNINKHLLEWQKPTMATTTKNLQFYPFVKSVKFHTNTAITRYSAISLTQLHTVYILHSIFRVVFDRFICIESK